MRLGGAEPAGQPQRHPRALELVRVRPLPGIRMVGDAERRVLGGGQGGRVRGVGRGGQRLGEPAEAPLPGERRQPAEVGEGRGLDLAEQRVGPQQVALRLLGLVAVQVVDRVAPGAGQEPADVRRDGPVAVEPLQSRGGGQEGGLVRPLGEDDLAGDGQAERVAGRAPLDDVEDRPGGRPQRRGQAAARGVAEFGRGREIAARPGAVRGPAEQPGQVGLAVLHAEGAVEDGAPGGGGVEHAGRDRGILAPGGSRFASSASARQRSRSDGSSCRALKRDLTPSQASTGKSLPRARRATTSWPSSSCGTLVSTTVGRARVSASASASRTSRTVSARTTANRRSPRSSSPSPCQGPAACSPTTRASASFWRTQATLLRTWWAVTGTADISVAPSSGGSSGFRA